MPSHDPRTGAGSLIVLPTYNEADNLPAIVPAIFAIVPRVRILVVDDLSPDGTGELADAMAADDPRIRVCHRDGERGLGRAYLHGFRLALEDPAVERVLEMDADFSHQPRYLPDLIAATERADLALGCRYMPGGGVEGWGKRRELLSKGGNLYARSILGLPYRDLTGGFKCFRRAVLEALELEAVRSRGYSFQIDLTWRAVQAGFSVAEVPIVFPDRRVGQSKMSGSIVREAISAVWRMRLGLD
ncbi:MAG: polyprenol monophosphomannose synthase [Alphaproteobacteria bacterium]|nr:polyprenol monophosphomannose synthase [Alphaproteobacteria bacterium]